MESPSWAIEDYSWLHACPSSSKESWGKAAKEMTEPRPTPTCTLCDIQGHATQNCMELHLLRTHMDGIEETDGAPVVTILDPRVVKNKSLRTNHPCVVCDLYGHYSHHFPKLPEYRSALRNLQKHSRKSYITILEEIHPSVSSSDTTNTIYMISTSSSPFHSSVVEDPPDLFQHHFRR